MDRPAEVDRYLSTLLRRDRCRLQRAFLSAGEAAAAAVAVLDTSQESSEVVTAARGRSTGGARRDGSPAVSLGNDAILAFWEVMSYPELLQDGEIEESFLTALRQVCTTLLW